MGKAWDRCENENAGLDAVSQPPWLQLALGMMTVFSAAAEPCYNRASHELRAPRATTMPREE